MHIEGPTAFYRGTASPLAGAAACSAIFFGANEQLKRAFTELNAKSGLDTLSAQQLFIAGGLAGLSNAAVSIPVEHVRIKM